MKKCTKSVFLLIQGEFGCFDFFPLLLLADDVEQKDPWCQANAHKHFLLSQVQIQVKNTNTDEKIQIQMKNPKYKHDFALSLKLPSGCRALGPVVPVGRSIGAPVGTISSFPFTSNTNVVQRFLIGIQYNNFSFISNTNIIKYKESDRVVLSHMLLNKPQLLGCNILILFIGYYQHSGQGGPRRSSKLLKKILLSFTSIKL